MERRTLTGLGDVYLRGEVVPRILAAGPAERIWLFGHPNAGPEHGSWRPMPAIHGPARSSVPAGSRARADARPDSGWNLMVVVPDQRAPAPARAAIVRALRGLAADLQIHVMTHTGFHDRLHLKASLPSTIAREGHLLYEEVSMGTRDAREWLRRARSDLTSAERNLAPPADPEKVATELEQAVEKAAKALLAEHDIPFARVHDLGALGEALATAEPDLGQRVRDLRVLGELYLPLRYPTEGGVEEPSLEEVADWTRSSQALLRDIAERIDVLARERVLPHRDALNGEEGDRGSEPGADAAVP